MKHSYFSALLLLFTLSISINPVFGASLSEIQKERIAHGQYLAYAADCVACHTQPGGQTFVGGRAIYTPMGTIYSTNITPDNIYGIGLYNYNDFVRALREGIAKDGHRLYPAMPYPSFAKMSDHDIHALYMFFAYGVKSVEQPNKENDISWPIRFRWLLSVWDNVFIEEGIYRPTAEQSDIWNRGAYLVQGVGHCGSCHTPRGFAAQEKALDHSDKLYLSGHKHDTWNSPNLRGDKNTGLGDWTEEDIVNFLKTNHVEKAALLGAMIGSPPSSTQYMTQQDLEAIAVYLKSLPPLVEVKNGD